MQDLSIDGELVRVVAPAETQNPKPKTQNPCLPTLATPCVYVMLWYGMVCYVMLWYGMVLYGMVWYGMLCYVMVWYGIIWYGMVWRPDET